MPNHITSSQPSPGARVRTADDHPEQPPAQRLRGEAGTSTAPEGLPPRPGGPALPLTGARAELWQWARQPRLLLDNRTALELTGARLLGTPERAAVPQMHAPGSLHLPAALPIPEAPNVRLPVGERHEVAAARRLVVDWLAELRRTAADLHAEGASPDDEADAMRKLDVLAMPAVVAALNAQDPQLHLVYAHCFAQGDQQAADRSGFGSVGWDAFMQDIRPGRWRVLVDNDAHGVALDVAVAHVPGQARPRGSVLMLNPLESPEMSRAGVVAELADQLRLPADWTLLVAEVAAQKSQRSCKIFALSMALKCGKGTFDQLHLARLNGMPVPLQLRDIDAALARPDESGSEDDAYDNSGNGDDSRDSDIDSDADSDAVGAAERRRAGSGPGEPAAPPEPVILGQELLHSPQLIGPAFMKHAQSRADVQAYVAARGPEAMQPVNGKGQTLLQRHEAHRVARFPASPAASSRQPRGSVQIYSASIELKRISFLDKAIRHAAACGPDEVQALAGAMRTADARWKDRFA